ncbi:MAG: hypothetical protein ACRDIY_22805 [Chloroflexota bacterium]
MPTGLPFHDVARLVRLRALLKDADPARSPRAIRIAGPADQKPARLALLPGSFNPLTNAHLALASLATGSGRVDQAWYVLASRTVDKERVEGASLADRLVCLSEAVRRRSRQGVLLVNRGLYVDQAELVREAMPFVDDLWLVVGYDKIVQIFDRRYYRDREAALGRLFARASFLVSSRAPASPGDLEAFLDQPENRDYRAKVVELGLAPRYQRMSSTRVRRGALEGQPSTDVPPVVQRFIEETGAYATPIEEASGRRRDRYGVRERLVDLAEGGQLPRMSEVEFQRAVERLVGSDGERRRAALDRGDLTRALTPVHAGAETEQLS